MPGQHPSVCAYVAEGRRERRTSHDPLLELARRHGGQVQVVQHDVLVGPIGEILDDADGECCVGDWPPPLVRTGPSIETRGEQTRPIAQVWFRLCHLLSRRVRVRVCVGGVAEEGWLVGGHRCAATGWRGVLSACRRVRCVTSRAPVCAGHCAGWRCQFKPRASELVEMFKESPFTVYGTNL